MTCNTETIGQLFVAELAPRPIQSSSRDVCIKCAIKMFPPSTTGTERAVDFWAKSVSLKLEN